jgi:DNA-binding MarR family transcriptional regulator
MSGGTDLKHGRIEEILRSLRLVKSVHGRHSKDLMRDFNITGTQLGVLRIVGRRGSISIGELSRRIYLHISTVSGIVDRLVGAGYLTRERSPGDRRVVVLELTPRGRDLVKQVPIAAFGFLVEDIESLSPTELRKISDALQILLRVMKIDGAGHPKRAGGNPKAGLRNLPKPRS